MPQIIFFIITTCWFSTSFCQNPVNELYKHEKDGLFEEHYLSGQLMCRCMIEDGKIVSKRECFYKNGETWVVEEFSKGKFNGKCFLLNEKQDTVYIERYANDTLLNTRNFYYYKSGKLKTKRIITYLNDDLKEGEKLVSSKRAISGVKTTLKEKQLTANYGTETRYYESGEVSDSLIIRNGLYNGEAKSFYRSGKLKSVSIYKDDQPESRIEYDESGVEKKRKTSTEKVK
ncbi:MORN repeat variant [compost metagenome]